MRIIYLITISSELASSSHRSRKYKRIVMKFHSFLLFSLLATHIENFCRSSTFKGSPHTTVSHNLGSSNRRNYKYIQILMKFHKFFVSITTICYIIKILIILCCIRFDTTEHKNVFTCYLRPHKVYKFISRY